MIGSFGKLTLPWCGGVLLVAWAYAAMQSSLVDLGQKLSALQFGRPGRSSARSSKAVSKELQSQLVQLAEGIMASLMELRPSAELDELSYDDIRVELVDAGLPSDHVLVCEKPLSNLFQRKLAVLKSPEGLEVRVRAHVRAFMEASSADQGEDDGLYSVSLEEVNTHLLSTGFTESDLDRLVDAVRDEVKRFTLARAPSITKKKDEMQELKSLFSGLVSPAPTPCNSEATISESIGSPSLSDDETLSDNVF